MIEGRSYTTEGGKRKIAARRDNKFHLPGKRTTRRKTHHQSKETGTADQPSSGTASGRVGEVIVWYTNTDVLIKETLTKMQNKKPSVTTKCCSSVRSKT